MQTLKFNQTLYYISKKYQSVLQEIAIKYNLTQVEVEVLLFLYNNPSYNTAKDIVEYRRLAKSFASKALELLLAKNYITIDIDKNDKRKNRIYLNDEVINICKEAQEKQRLFFKSLFKDIENEELNIFFNTLSKMYHNAKEI